MRKKSFSYLSFVGARFKRIFPAFMTFLAILCVCIFAFSPFMQLEKVVESLTYIHRAFFMVSNVQFAVTNGYFHPGMRTNPVLHTWSLSTEWQFYLILPLLMFCVRWLCVRLKIKSEIVFVFALTCVWGVVGKLSSDYFPGPSYYLVNARAWEMMLGGLTWSVEDWVMSYRDFCSENPEYRESLLTYTLACLKKFFCKSRRSKFDFSVFKDSEEGLGFSDQEMGDERESPESLNMNIASVNGTNSTMALEAPPVKEEERIHNFNSNPDLWSLSIQVMLLCLGSALMVVPLFVISPSTKWPGVWTLAPTIGTSFFILANTRSWCIWKFPVFNQVGDASYSIYLYHWPLVVLAFSPDAGNGQPPFIISAIIFSFLFGFIL
eukprot:GDKJ01015054.1.p1 GENE.GDKJ01015054.1~~GDKJ01015054.1.p1  ORF type:complete len:414 (-),score=45.54 GDKJ01015054.1:17-1150(-)